MPENTTLADVLASHAKATLADVHKAKWAKVVEFNATTCTVAATPVVRHSYTIDGEEYTEDYPTIIDIPVCYPRGGGMVMTWPLSAGDMVLLVFQDEDTSAFRISGRTADPTHTQRHGITACVALPGAWPDSSPPAAGDASARSAGIVIGANGGSAQIRFATGEIKLGATASDYVALAAKVDAAVDTLKTAINTHQHTSAAPGAPTTPIPAFPTGPIPGTIPPTAATVVKAL